MGRPTVVTLTVVIVLMAAAGGRAQAQSLGTFRWQLQPFCNAVVANVVQQGAVFTLDGYDDMCGAVQRAPLVGLATLNADGTIAIGLTIVTSAGRGVQVGARLSPATISGTWTDSGENRGTFAFNANTGGNPRVLPVSAVVPTAIQLLTDGGLAAIGSPAAGPIPASGTGARMMWYPGKFAFRAGVVNGTEWDDPNVGSASVALGSHTTASGGSSTALGYGTTASGFGSLAAGQSAAASGNYATALGYLTTASNRGATALGYQTVASGDISSAFGDSTTASGESATALGRVTVASGTNSTAMGFATTASGVVSTAMGSNTEAYGIGSTAMGGHTIGRGRYSTVMGSFAETGFAAEGSFVYGDISTSGVVASVSPNQFLVRAAGGTVFWSTPATTYPTSPGVILNPGASSWSSLSDVNSKDHFRELVDDDVLARIARMPVREWSYKAQDAAIRHMGPTAQDFHAAFGLGEDPLRINTIDADGVALAAARALEKRTRASDEHLTRRNEALTAEVESLRARLTRLEQLLLDRK